MHDLAPLKLASPIIDEWSRARIPARLESGFLAGQLKLGRSRDADVGRRLGLPGLLGSTMIGAVEALSIGPGEWLVLALDKHAHELAQLRNAYEAEGISWIPCESRIRILTIDASRSLVASLAGLPQGSLNTGHVVRGRLADLPVVIAATETAVRLIFDRTYVSHLRAWLDRAI